VVIEGFLSALGIGGADLVIEYVAELGARPVPTILTISARKRLREAPD